MSIVEGWEVTELSDVARRHVRGVRGSRMELRHRRGRRPGRDDRTATSRWRSGDEAAVRHRSGCRRVDVQRCTDDVRTDAEHRAHHRLGRRPRELHPGHDRQTRSPVSTPPRSEASTWRRSPSPRKSRARRSMPRSTGCWESATIDPGVVPLLNHSIDLPRRGHGRGHRFDAVPHRRARTTADDGVVFSATYLYAPDLEGLCRPWWPTSRSSSAPSSPTADG